MASGMGSGTAGAPAAAATAPASKVGANANGRDSEPTAAGGFAGVLAGTRQADASPADGARLPPPPDTTTAASDDTELPLDSELDDSVLPDQILNLLGGWPPPAPDTPVPASGMGEETVETLGTLALPGLVPSTSAEDGSDVATGLQPLVNKTNATPEPSITGAATLSPTGIDAADSDKTEAFAKSLALAAGADGPDEALSTPSTDDAVVERVEFALPTSQSMAASPARQAAAAAAAQPLAMPADPDAGFDDDFGARIGWLADQRIGHAQIRVSPEHVGPIDVRLHLDGTRVNAEFSSANADVRQALEASVGKLRDMLNQQGLQLGHTDVGSGQSGSGDRGQAGPSAGISSGEDAFGDATVLPPAFTTRRGLLDEYA